MHMAPATDQGTLLRADQAALVFDADGRMSLVLPAIKDDAPVPPIFQLLMSIAIQCDDPDWVSEMIASYKPE